MCTIQLNVFSSKVCAVGLVVVGIVASVAYATPTHAQRATLLQEHATASNLNQASASTFQPNPEDLEMPETVEPGGTR